MCLIIASIKPPFAPIQDQHMEAGWASNDDGAGFMVAHNGELILRKFLKYDGFREAIDPYLNLGCPMVVHFRAASTQSTTSDMDCVHPMRISDTSGYCHNGFLNDMEKHPNSSKRIFTKSDTFNFNELVVKDLHNHMPDWWLNPCMSWITEKSVGTNNKLVFLNARGEYRIINEDEGIADGDFWFSNNMYKYRRNACSSTEAYWLAKNSKNTNPAIPIATPPTTTIGPRTYPSHPSPSTDVPEDPACPPSESITLDDLSKLDEYLDQLNSKRTSTPPKIGIVDTPIVPAEIAAVITPEDSSPNPAIENTPTPTSHPDANDLEALVQNPEVVTPPVEQPGIISDNEAQIILNEGAGSVTVGSN